MKAYYNSWDENFKRPFGAVKINQTITWRIIVDDPNVQVYLQLARVGDQEVANPMQQHDGSTWEYQLALIKPGLYYYYFEIHHQEKTIWAGRNDLGQITLTDDYAQLQKFQLTCYQFENPTPDWYCHGVAYQIFPDRFFNGHPHKEITGRKPNSFLYATEQDQPYYIKNSDGEIVRWDFYGGNIAGIQAKIPYLKSLGVTILYLNPIFAATSNHRYDTNDFFTIDPMLGSEDEFKNLVTSPHQNGTHLILDGVFNHVGEDSIYFNAHQLYGPNTGASQNQHSPFYSWFKFTHYPDKYASWWGVSNLPEVNKADPSYQDFIYGNQGVLHKWDQLGVDGWRLDVADELPMAFLRQLRHREKIEGNQVLIGEVWEDASNKYVGNELRTYPNGDNLSGTMNYPVRNFITNYLRQIDVTKTVTDYLGLIENYPCDFMQNCLNNIGTHDTIRIKTALNNDEQLVQIAFAMLFMLPGVPCLYYGDEAGLVGAKDPDNRRFFPWDQINQTIQATVKNWIKRRRQEDLLVTGEIGLAYDEQGHLMIVRYQDHQAVLLLINPSKCPWTVNPHQLTHLHLPATICDQLGHFLKEKQVAGKQSQFIKL